MIQDHYVTSNEMMYDEANNIVVSPDPLLFVVVGCCFFVLFTGLEVVKNHPLLPEPIGKCMSCGILIVCYQL